jgi:phosphoserine phosphatase
MWLPFDIVIFDCDSTLSTVEGIDELARWQGKEKEIEALTNAAMNGELDLSEVYSRRLEILNPTRDHIDQLGRLYVDTLVPDAREVVGGLQAAGRKVFIVSGGLAAGVRAFGVWLGILDARIHAVELEYNQLAGRWWETWTHPAGRNGFEQVLAHDGGPLTIGKGKADIIRRIRAEHAGRAMLVGDGTSDLEAAPAVDLFVGFGGVVSRDKVRASAPAFINTLSLAPILPMALARPDAPPGFEAAFARGVSALHQGQVTLAQADARLALLQRLL